jgi:uncharacterized protein YjbI with pentapeptide repeats/DNA-binding XRE family transcriptional regulator
MIGNKIYEARRKQNLSQAQLAQLLSVSSQAVGKWERGESMPDIITLNRLAELLYVDMNYFSENPESAAVKTPTEPTLETAGRTAEKPQKKAGWDMSCGNWVDADFSGLKNLRDKFTSSNMQRCIFIASELPGLLLRYNNVEGCDFSESDIGSSRFQSSSIMNSQFRKCLLKGTEFVSSNIKGCDFAGADFSGAVFKYSTYGKNTNSGAVWNGTTFNGSQLSDIVFDGTLRDCSFENCSFSRVTFRNAMLITTFFKNKSLKHISFVDCKADNITLAFLKSGKADLTGITLFS